MVPNKQQIEPQERLAIISLYNEYEVYVVASENI